MPQFAQIGKERIVVIQALQAVGLSPGQGKIGLKGLDHQVVQAPALSRSDNLGPPQEIVRQIDRYPHGDSLRDERSLARRFAHFR